ncbi:MAG: 2-amino-4-hydroxy-6-hydroxymethyldihydropteridine diphosphokinase [Acidaminococcaceae bacterium]|nr:2-amino-4-hydroxy-6-hydroxymethyldihydropteridine diphosphokinase [Acidaminococcaceae bacterium]
MSIFIALGSNLGNKEKNLKDALKLLEKKGVRVRRVSGFIRTRPYGVTDQPDFLNAVAEIETDISPTELLQLLLQTEQEMGRKRVRRWGERNIDLDLLLYDDRIIDLPELKVPHPDMQNRDFVLCPLAQIAPDAVHPVLRKTAGELWKELQDRGRIGNIYA